MRTSATGPSTPALWGHRIPAWYCDDCEEIIARKKRLLLYRLQAPLCQDEDTLIRGFLPRSGRFRRWWREYRRLPRVLSDGRFGTGYDIISSARMIFRYSSHG